MADAEPKNSIQVIGRMSSLLDELSLHAEPVGLKALAQATGLHPSTAHRILTALVTDHLVERVEPGSYRLGIRLLELGNLVKSRISVREHALPYMRELHAATDEAVNLSVRRDDEIVYIERTSSGSAMMRVVNIVGARAPLHITSVGKLFLTTENPSELKAYVDRTRLPAYTKNSLITLAALDKELDKVRKQGFAHDNEEAEIGVRCIGAGIRDDAGTLVAGLSVSAPTERMKPAWAALIKETAARISRAIGYRGTQGTG